MSDQGPGGGGDGPPAPGAPGAGAGGEGGHHWLSGHGGAASTVTAQNR